MNTQFSMIVSKLCFIHPSIKNAHVWTSGHHEQGKQQLNLLSWGTWLCVYIPHLHTKLKPGCPIVSTVSSAIHSESNNWQHAYTSSNDHLDNTILHTWLLPISPPARSLPSGSTDTRHLTWHTHTYLVLYEEKDVYLSVQRMENAS